MKLFTNTGAKPEAMTPQEAVQFVADRAERGSDDTLERMRYRTEAVANMLGRLLSVMVDNGSLRAGQVEAIFDYDISAED